MFRHAGSGARRATGLTGLARDRKCSNLQGEVLKVGRNDRTRLDMLTGQESALFKDPGACLRLGQDSPMEHRLFEHGMRVNLKQQGLTLGIGRIEVAAWFAAAKRQFLSFVVACMARRLRRPAAAGAGAAETPRSQSINSTR